MNPYIGVLGYVGLFALVWGLLRYEFEMPRIISVAFGGAIVMLGFLATFVAQMAGIGGVFSLPGLTAGALVSLSLTLSIVN